VTVILAQGVVTPTAVAGKAAIVKQAADAPPTVSSVTTAVFKESHIVSAEPAAAVSMG
jgi:hypothetical protein